MDPRQQLPQDILDQVDRMWEIDGSIMWLEERIGRKISQQEHDLIDEIWGEKNEEMRLFFENQAKEAK